MKTTPASVHKVPGPAAAPLLSLFLLLMVSIAGLAPCGVDAAAIPADRLPPAGRWSPGIPGGIPTNYTQFCNVRVAIPGSPLVAAGDGVTDDTAAINAALELCPDGQYVFLPEGVYRCNGTIARRGVYNHDGAQHHFSVVLRGEGPAKTRILSYASGDCIAFSPGLGPIGGGAIVSGHTRGSTSIVAPLSVPSLYSVGKWILVRRQNAESGAFEPPGYMSDTCSQLVRVTSLSGGGAGTNYTIGFTPELNEGHPGDSVGMFCSAPYRCGVEDLYVERMTNTANQNIVFSGAQECWVKNVESHKARKWHIRLNTSAGCEVRQCHVHDAWDAGGDAGYGIGLFAYSCSNLVEDNIGVRVRHAYILEYGGQNNVIAYNYSKDPINNDRGPGEANQLLTDYLMGDLTLHGGNPRWNLFEGNVGATICFDVALGGSDYNTAFRNRIQRKGLPSTYVANFGSDIQRGNYYVNLVGNVYENKPPNSGAPLRRWGTRQDDATSIDPLSESTAYLHGEYDLAAGAAAWDAGNPDHALPASLYLMAKPAWWGSSPWPAFGPESPAAVSAAALPAAARYAAMTGGIASPSITAHPQSATVAPGETISFSVSAAGGAPLSFQWRKDGVSIAGATSATFDLTNVQNTHAGTYSVVVSNPAGAATSSGAILTVTGSPGGAARLINISTRSLVGVGDAIQIAGFVIGGAAPKRVIVRAGGPALATLGVGDLLTDPVLTIFSGSTAIAQNDNWDAALAADFAQVGAFDWTPGSADAALAVTLAPGAYTAHVAGKAGAAGVAIVEVYDTEPPGSGGRLVNLSTRSLVGTGNGVQIGGFVIPGSGSKRVLVRAVGPSLAQAQVAGVLTDPVLTVFSGFTVIAQNDDWEPALAAEFASVGAAAWTPGSKDAALVLTLAAGAYTVHVAGANQSTGVALVEVFEVN